jgi:hypothetical protein
MPTTRAGKGDIVSEGVSTNRLILLINAVIVSNLCHPSPPSDPKPYALLSPEAPNKASAAHFEKRGNGAVKTSYPS